MIKGFIAYTLLGYYYK